MARKEIKTTRIFLERKFLGIPFLSLKRTESEEKELVYEDLETEGLREKSGRIMQQEMSGSFPKEFRDHATTFVSEMYNDAKTLWNPDNVGDFDPERTVFILSVDEKPSDVGDTLRKGKIRPQRLLLLINNTFSTFNGRYNVDFQDFLKSRIVMRMGLTQDEKKEFNIEKW